MRAGCAASIRRCRRPLSAPPLVTRGSAAKIFFVSLVSLVVPLLTGVRSGAQTLPSSPLVFADGHVTIGGDVSASFGSDDGSREHPGFFNFTDYEHSALRTLRIDVSAIVKGGDRLSVVGEMRTENFDRPEAYALYLRVRPWPTRNFDVQAGRIPPTFGAFTRRTYPTDNPLIGYPLAYQYLTSLRPDALPASAAELLTKRGLGWLDQFSIPTGVKPERGVPLVSAFRWDTGVQAHGGSQLNLISAAASISAGTVSNPLVIDDNSRPQIAGRIEVRPVTGLVAGASAARGPFVTDEAARAAAGDGHDHEFTQQALGGDVEYSRDYYLLRFETIVSDWRLPIVRAPELKLPLRAVSTSAEGRYKFAPGVYAAARFDHLGFSTITGSPAQGTLPWDAPTTRVEIGGGWSVQRNLLFKVSFQRNTRDGGPLLRVANLGACQVVYWW